MVKLKRILLSVAVVYLGVALAMTLLQRELLYVPIITPIESPKHYGVAAEAMTLQGGAGRLAAWYAAPKTANDSLDKLPPAQVAERSVESGAQSSQPIILYFQGNSGNFSGRINKFKGLLNEGFGLLALSYRGFNGSEGEATEDGLYEDARTALAWVKAKHPDLPIIYYGESLGTGVAVQLATEDPPSLLVLEAPYTSVVDRAAEIYWWLPVPLLLRDRFESLDKIRSVKAPLLVFHNSGDEVIPFHHGKEIYAAANPPKKAYWGTRRGHIDFDWPRQARRVKVFMKQQTGNNP